MEQKHWVMCTLIIDVAVVIANIVELTLLFKNRKKLDRIEHMLLSLSVSDFLAGVCMFGQDVNVIDNIYKKGKPKMSTTEAMILDGLFIFFVLVSNFHVIAIAIERLVAVVLPHNYSIFMTCVCKTFTICFVWISSTIITFAIMFSIKATAIKWKSGEYATAGVILFACITVFVIYIALSIALVIKERGMVQLLPAEMKKLARDRKTTLFCLLIGFSFVICFLPIMLGLLDQSLYHPIANVLVTFNHFLNPFIYFAKFFYEKRKRRFDSVASRASRVDS